MYTEIHFQQFRSRAQWQWQPRNGRTATAQRNGETATECWKLGISYRQECQER